MNKKIRQNIIVRSLIFVIIAMAFLMLEGMNAHAEDDNDDFQVYYENVDSNYYDYDGFHMKVKIVNGAPGVHQYRIGWACKYEEWGWGKDYEELVVHDTYEGIEGYYGTGTQEFVFYPGMGGKSFGNWLYWYCIVINENGVVKKTDGMVMPSPLHATPIEHVEFTDVTIPKVGNKFDSTAESPHPEQYSAKDRVRWYKVDNTTGEESQIVADTIATAGTYCCRVYIDTERGYGVDMSTASASVSGVSGKIYWDSTKNKHYVKAWFQLDGTPKIVDTSKSFRASFKDSYVMVTALNAKEYRWQKYENGKYRDIVLNEGYTGFMGAKLRIYPGNVVNDMVRCKVTGYDDTVIYSEPVHCITCARVELSPKYVLAGKGDKVSFSYTMPQNVGTVKNTTWYFRLGEDGIWQECKNYPEYFSSLQRTSLTIDSVDEALINSTCQVKCVIDFNDSLGSIETDVASIDPHRHIIAVGNLAYLFEDDEPQYGWQEYAGNTYYFGDETDRSMRTGWQLIDEKWYFFKDSGAMLKNEWKQYKGYWYYFDDKGVMVTGWKQIGGKWYFFDNEGRMQTGWLEYKEKTYYLNDKGVMVTGEIMIDGKLYNFGSDGALIKSAQKQSIWKQFDNKWYYFGSDGARTVGWKNISGKWYHFDTKGIMETGWKYIGAKWYYFGANGAMITGWKQISLKWYYFDVNGAMATGWKQIGSKWYSFDTSGIMETGWKKSGAKWYYLGDSGAMTTGWKQVGANWYYFKADGTMVANETLTISGKTYKFNTNGVWISK